MTWDELREVLSEEVGNHGEIEVLIGDMYHPIELVRTTKDRMFFVPAVETNDGVE